MLATVVMWLKGMWYAGTEIGTVIKDCNGDTISMGDTVKAVGVVTGINPTHPHWGDIEVTLSHPNGTGPCVGTEWYFYPLQLVKGS